MTVVQPALRRLTLASHASSLRGTGGRRASRDAGGGGGAAAASSGNVYAEQLKPGSLSDETIETVKRLARVKSLFYQRRVHEDTCVVFAAVGVVLMCAEVELLQNRAGSACDDSGLCFWLKAAVSASTAALLICVALKYATQVQLLSAQGKLPPGATLPTTPGLRGWFLLEFLLCAFHVPPGLFDGRHFTVPSNSGGLTPSHRYPVDVLGVFMWARLYLMSSLVRNHSGYYSQQVAYVCALNNVSAESPAFHFKLMFRDKPLRLLGPFGLVMIVATTLATQAVERAHNEDLAGLWDCLWLTIVTVSTVGYGDRSPLTALGRVFMTCGGIVAGVIFIGLVTTVLLQHVQLHPNEAVVLRYHRATTWNAEVVQRAVVLLQRAWRWHAERRAPGSGGRATRTTSSWLFKAVCAHKRVRAGQPMWNDEEMGQLLEAVEGVEEQHGAVQDALAAQGRALAALGEHMEHARGAARA
eukprot:g4911.t1